MSEFPMKDERNKKDSSKVEICNLRVPLKAKAIQKIDESKNLKRILKIRPHSALQEKIFLFAISTNNTERVHKLLKSGIDANVTDEQLRSALHLATSKGYVEIVRLLLDYGADPNKLDSIHNTPLHLAACLNNFQIIKMLLDAGADVRSLDAYGRNPVQLAQSKLQLLRLSWREGTIEVMQLRKQIQQVCFYGYVSK